MRALILVDLDDTLFQTRGKCPPDLPADRLRALGFGRDGAPLGFATPRQIAFLSWLGESGLLIPVTGRSREALMRVDIPFAAAICAHGGVIVGGDGAPDADWGRHVAAEAARHADTLAELLRAADEIAAGRGSPIRARLLSEDGVDLYLLLKHPDGDAAALDAVVDALAPRVPAGWTLHRNGNNAAMLPPFLGKAHAVAALLPRLRALHPEAPAIGVGDSLTDAPFMALCDYAMMPSGSQLSLATLGALA